MTLRLHLGLDLCLYLPLRRKGCLSASTCRHRVSEMCAPWCARQAARPCVSRTASLVNGYPPPRSERGLGGAHPRTRITLSTSETSWSHVFYLAAAAFRDGRAGRVRRSRRVS